jgi:aminoglycoside phosphotransferase family enzyme
MSRMSMEPSVTDPDGAGPNAVETHISWLFFVGDRAYKAKKPVALAFLDFSTPEARERACHALQPDASVARNRLASEG